MTQLTLGFRKGDPVEWTLDYLKVRRRGFFQQLAIGRPHKAQVLSENGLVEVDIANLNRNDEWFEIKDGWGTVPMA